MAGCVFDVAVDVRRSSATFGQWVGAHLSADNRHMLWVPPGFAHGFLALEDATDLLYKCTHAYAPEHDRAIRWDDPTIGIAWPLAGLDQITLSAKDEGAPLLMAAELFP